MEAVWENGAIPVRDAGAIRNIDTGKYRAVERMLFTARFSVVVRPAAHVSSRCQSGIDPAEGRPLLFHRPVRARIRVQQAKMLLHGGRRSVTGICSGRRRQRNQISCIAAGGAAGKEKRIMAETGNEIRNENSLNQEEKNRQNRVQEFAGKQIFYQKITMIASIITAVVVFVTAVLLVPRTLTMMNEAQATMEEVHSMTEEAQGMFQDLNSISGSLNSFVNGNGEEGSGLSNLDIDALNKSIRNLQAIVEPLARLLGQQD